MSENTSTLTSALKETLQRTGTLDDIRAQLRSTIFQCMNESLPTAVVKEEQSIPIPPIENVLINEIIAEYLSFNGYNQTLSVFNAESQTSSKTTTGMNGGSGYTGGAVGTLGEAFIRAELGCRGCLGCGGSNNDSLSSLPMLYEIIEMLKERKRNV